MNFDTNLNMIMIDGFLGKAPELEYTANGKPVTKFAVCTNHTWKNADGEMQTAEEWHYVKAWNGTAESVVQYLKKGSHVRVTGRMHYDSFVMKDADGNEVWFGDKKIYRNFATIIADNIVFLPNFEKREEKAEATTRPAGAVMAGVKPSSN